MKIKWVMENCSDAIKAMEEGTCLFGTVDTWLIWVSEREREEP
jgi:glycerol kinase